MFGHNFIRRASGIYSPALIGLAGRWRFLACPTCCPTPSSCTGCTAGTAPDEIEVTIAGWGSCADPYQTDYFPCQYCSDLNQSYILTGASLTLPYACSYSYGDESPCPGSSFTPTKRMSVTATINASLLTVYFQAFQFDGYPQYPAVATFQKAWTATDCSSMSGVSVPCINYSEGIWDSTITRLCCTSGPTCLVSAV